MQMIDVLKRLAELDAKNPNVLKENQQVEECGIMPDYKSSFDKPSTPASINMTAASGEELGDLIRSIANLTKDNTDYTDHDHDTEMKPLSAMPSIGVSAMDGDGDMRSMIDKLNDIEDEKTDETYDTTPEDPNPKQPFDSEQYAHHENPPGAAQGRGLKNHPVANPMESIDHVYESLMADYRKFVLESNFELDSNRNKLEPIEGEYNVTKYFNYGTSLFKGNEVPVAEKILDWIKQAAGLSPDAPVGFDNADLTYKGDIVVRSALYSRMSFNDVVDYLKDYLDQTISEDSSNEIIINGKEVDSTSIEVDGVDPRDSPDFSDAYVSAAVFMDGTPLDDDELDQLNDNYPELIHDLAHDSLH